MLLYTNGAFSLNPPAAQTHDQVKALTTVEWRLKTAEHEFYRVIVSKRLRFENEGK